MLQVTDKLCHIMLNTLPWSRFELPTSVVIGTDCIGSCKSNYHAITAGLKKPPSWICKWANYPWFLDMTTMICWRCHSNSVNTGSRLPICSDVKTRKRRNVVGIDMIRNNRIIMYLRNLFLKIINVNFILKRHICPRPGRDSKSQHQWW
jgi:hypothetical protein